MDNRQSSDGGTETDSGKSAVQPAYNPKNKKKASEITEDELKSGEKKIQDLKVW